MILKNFANSQETFVLEPTACIFTKKRPRTGVSGGFYTTPEIQK